jgi:anti-sigma28 factor (negative regulator of flagellin synthesis)
MSDINPIGRPEMNGVQHQKAASQQRAQPSQQAGRQASDDRVQLSNHARLLSQIRQNPIREDLVNRVRDELAQGTYESEAKVEQAIDELQADLD